MKDLNNGTYRISDAATDLKAQITKYNASLDKLRNEIRTYEILISTGAGLVGTGAFVVIVGGCIALKFPVAGAIVAIIGAVAIIAGGTIWGVYEKKIKKAADEISPHILISTGFN